MLERIAGKLVIAVAAEKLRDGRAEAGMLREDGPDAQGARLQLRLAGGRSGRQPRQPGLEIDRIAAAGEEPDQRDRRGDLRPHRIAAARPASSVP